MNLFTEFGLELTVLMTSIKFFKKLVLHFPIFVYFPVSGVVNCSLFNLSNYRYFQLAFKKCAKELGGRLQ